MSEERAEQIVNDYFEQFGATTPEPGTFLRNGLKHFQMTPFKRIAIPPGTRGKIR